MWLKRRITPAAFIAVLLAVYLTVVASAAIFDTVNNQFTIANSGTSASQWTIRNSGTSASWWTVGRTGEPTNTQNTALYIVVTFGVIAIILLFLALTGALSVGTVVIVAAAGIVAMMGMMFLANILSGI